MNTLKKQMNKLKRESKIITDFNLQEFAQNDSTHNSEYQSHNSKNDNELQNNCCNIHCKNSVHGNYIILSCNHIFHMSCIIDTCGICNTFLKNEEKIFIHINFKSQLTETINITDNKIQNLEKSLQIIKNEIFEYTNYIKSIEYNKSISKNIITTITTLL